MTSLHVILAVAGGIRVLWLRAYVCMCLERGVVPKTCTRRWLPMALPC